MEVDTLKKKKRTIKSKEFNRRTRDENIREFEKRTAGKKGELKIAKSETPKITKDEIRKKLKPLQKMVKTEVRGKPRPFLVLKNQESLLVERDYELVEAINKSYIDESKHGQGGIKDKGDLRQKNLYFSNVGDCPREIYYKFFEPERARDYTVKGLILFDEGRAHHRNIQRRLEDRGIGRNPEGFLEIPSCGAVGYYDELVNVGSENGWIICDMGEIKSKLPYACEEVAQRDYDQAQLYHHAAQFSKRLKTKRIKIRNIRIVYKDRAIQTDEVHFSWIAKPDLDRQQQIIEYFQWLHDVVITKKFLSPHPYEKKSTKCQYCRFKDWCWRKYPDQIIEEKEEITADIKLPEKEILDSYAKKVHEILKKEAELKAEKDKLIPILLAYFSKTKNPIYPVTVAEALAPRQSNATTWDIEGLKSAIGLEMYAKISEPKGKHITDLINREFVDAAKFEEFKKYKPKKPSIYIKKIQGGSK